jgi:hypothetical protein
MFTKFKSLAGTEFAYAWDTQAWDMNAPLEAHFRQFYVYNDGLTAHSESWSVQVEYLTDFLASLSEACLTNDELAKDVLFTIHRRPRLEEIEFAASVIYKEPANWNKRKFFSAKEMKISGNQDKEHDKRYEEVKDWCDGSPKAIFRILIGEYASGMTKYSYAEAIREWALKQPNMYMEMAAEFLGWFKGDDQREKARALRDAYEACYNITESYRLRHAAESGVANYKRRIEQKRFVDCTAAQEAQESAATVGTEAKQ